MTKRGTQGCRYVISVLVADRVGILRDISSAVTSLGGNIDGLSQTVVEGYFTVILTSTFGRRISPDKVREGILRSFRPNEALALVREHRPAKSSPVPRGERYLLTVTGKDHKGVVRKITEFLAERGINIEDWFMKLEGDNASYLGEVTVPASLDVRRAQDQLAGLLGPMKLRASLQHENIFRVTGEIGSVRSMLEPRGSE